MKIEFTPHDRRRPARTARLAVLAFEGAVLEGAVAALNKQTGGMIDRALAVKRFTGAAGQTLDLTAPHGVDVARIVVVGAGKKAKFDGRGPNSPPPRPIRRSRPAAPTP